MKQLLDKAVATCRLRLSLSIAGLSDLSVSTYVAGVTVGGASLTESPIFVNVYASTPKKSYTGTNTRLNLGNQEIIVSALRGGETDIVPEYLGALFDSYNSKAGAISQQDVNAELAQALPADSTPLNPTLATSITVWVIHAEATEKYHLRILLDLKPIAPQLVIGGPPGLAIRALELPGLKRVYSLEFKAIKSLDMDGSLTRLVPSSDKIDVATVVSTQGSLAKEKWVVLKDDKHEQLSQNVVPLVRKVSLTPRIGAVLNEVPGKSDNATLVALSQQADLQHKDLAVVAEQWVNANLFQH